VYAGLETVYKLFMVDVVIPGFHRKNTGDAFDSSESPELSTGKVHMTFSCVPLHNTQEKRNWQVIRGILLYSCITLLSGNDESLVE
jgi:hypothetical protein